MSDHVDVIALIAESKIAEAMSEGAFDNLPGAGKPLPEDDLAMWPAESRLAIRILRNGGWADSKDEGAFPGDIEPAAEAARLTRRMTRLQLAIDKRAPAKGGSPSPRRKALERSPEEEELNCPKEDSILDSPYLAKVLDKLYG